MHLENNLTTMAFEKIPVIGKLTSAGISFRVKLFRIVPSDCNSYNYCYLKYSILFKKSYKSFAYCSNESTFTEEQINK